MNKKQIRLLLLTVTTILFFGNVKPSFEDLFKGIDFDELAKDVEKMMQEQDTKQVRSKRRINSRKKKSPIKTTPIKATTKPIPIRMDKKNLFIDPIIVPKKSDLKEKIVYIFPKEKKDSYDFYMGKFVNTLNTIEKKIHQSQMFSPEFKEHFLKKEIFFIDQITVADGFFTDYTEPFFLPILNLTRKEIFSLIKKLERLNNRIDFKSSKEEKKTGDILKQRAKEKYVSPIIEKKEFLLHKKKRFHRGKISDKSITQNSEKRQKKSHKSRKIQKTYKKPNTEQDNLEREISELFAKEIAKIAKKLTDASKSKEVQAEILKLQKKSVVQKEFGRRRRRPPGYSRYRPRSGRPYGRRFGSPFGSPFGRNSSRRSFGSPFGRSPFGRKSPFGRPGSPTAQSPKSSIKPSLKKSDNSVTRDDKKKAWPAGKTPKKDKKKDKYRNIVRTTRKELINSMQKFNQEFNKKNLSQNQRNSIYERIAKNFVPKSKIDIDKMIDAAKNLTESNRIKLRKPSNYKSVYNKFLPHLLKSSYKLATSPGNFTGFKTLLDEVSKIIGEKSLNRKTASFFNSLIKEYTKIISNIAKRSDEKKQKKLQETKTVLEAFKKFPGKKPYQKLDNLIKKINKINKK